jgi:cation diffusion facilitator CzcD-associated flavoprotein CzcO
MQDQFHTLYMQDQFHTFSMFDAQALYARDVIFGRIKLPSKVEMAKDDDAWVKREEALKDAFQKIPGRLCARPSKRQTTRGSTST